MECRLKSITRDSHYIWARPGSLAGKKALNSSPEFMCQVPCVTRSQTAAVWGTHPTARVYYCRDNGIWLHLRAQCLADCSTLERAPVGRLASSLASAPHPQVVLFKPVLHSRNELPPLICRLSNAIRMDLGVLGCFSYLLMSN